MHRVLDMYACAECFGIKRVGEDSALRRKPEGVTLMMPPHAPVSKSLHVRDRLAATIALLPHTQATNTHRNTRELNPNP